MISEVAWKGGATEVETGGRDGWEALIQDEFAGERGGLDGLGSQRER